MLDSVNSIEKSQKNIVENIVLSAENLTRSYQRGEHGQRTFDAVKDVSLDLRSGMLTEIVGHSGSGKTTLLNMAAGLLTPSSGKVLLDGKDMYSLSDNELSRLRNEKIGVVPQGQTALSSLTVLENVLFPSTLYRRLVPDETVDRAKKLLCHVGLTDLMDSMPSELSGGELRRMAIVRALINRPKVLMADEPTGDLDKENTRIVLEILRKTASGGTAVLLVTHEADAAHYADVVYEMEEGRLTRKEE